MSLSHAVLTYKDATSCVIQLPAEQSRHKCSACPRLQQWQHSSMLGLKPAFIVV